MKDLKLWFNTFNKNTSYDQLNKLVFEFCGSNDFLNYCGFFYEEIKGNSDQNSGLGDVGRDTEMVLRGLEVNLCFRRLRMSFCGANGASAPPPSSSLRCLDIKTTGFRRNLWLVLIIDICLRLTYFSSIHNTMMKNKIRVEKWFNADRYVYIYIYRYA